MRKFLKPTLLLVLAGVMGAAFAQQAPLGTVLKSQLNLSSFGASSGNDCWGYVSPSGREYALVGLNNQVAVVEVTNPSSPVVIGTIPHGSSTWGDIKTYGQYAYAVTESATGIQVIDLSQVDNGVVTLVRTLDTPSRNHNIHVDTVNGFLYTLGSRGNVPSGTTRCFSLANPSNPVQVGPTSMTFNAQGNAVYLHDGQVVTYTSGPMAGKQLLYGFSEGRGVDVYDVTNKNAPFLLTRVTYPNINYCHQGWISEDGRFLYVDDELDENGTFPTRSLVFNVEDPVNSVYVGTFTSGLNAIDHNQYTKDGFIFQANYRSGLRIFDYASSPSNPVQVGWYDTFAANDNTGFDGAWSNYPSFPSGTVIVSDINAGLFVLDVTEATTRTKPVETLLVTGGVTLEGSVNNLFQSDDVRMKVGYTGQGGQNLDPVIVEFTVKSYDTQPDRIIVDIEAQTSMKSSAQTVEIWNWTTNSWAPLGSTRVGTSDVITQARTTKNIDKYVNQSDRTIKVRAKYTPASPAANYSVSLDRVVFRLTR